MASKIRNAFTCSMITALMVMSLTPATAHLQSKGDSNDTTGPLDIRSSTFNDIDGEIRVSTKTRGDWSLQTLGAGTAGDDAFFRWQFDSKGGTSNDGFRYTDYFVVVDNIEGELSGALFRWVPPYPTSEFKFMQEVPASRDGRTVKARFDSKLINPRDTFIDWLAETWLHPNSGPCSSGCYDANPNQDQNYYRHNL